MSPEERAFLKRVLQQFGLETDTALMPTYGDDVAGELAELPEALRQQTLELVIQAAVADGQVVPEERAFVDLVAGQLGVSHQDISDRLAQLIVSA